MKIERLAIAALSAAMLSPAVAAEELSQRVLVFGDSNTWGAIPSATTPGHRYPAESTWPYILDTLLPADVDVIAEGLGGRTTDFDSDPGGVYRYSGAEMLPSVLASHRPIDVLVIMLGTNDLFAAHDRSIEDIALGVEHLVTLAQETRPPGTNEPAPRILVVAPPAIDETIEGTPFASYFEGGVEKSQGFPEAYAEVAERLGVGFFDAGSVVATDTEDGIHFDLDDHAALAAAIAAPVKDLLDAE
ncbi:GDSL-type esterase/lipase family protein [Devosia sediminis]|uniref:SGNH hydrolase-type esterase domain-containing protein n=1 Tax=Devosia sediminis TaxID=2798801 RepID=A0A934IYB4_9HYPH|nr:GDSL-type esterase/lipase family protein [Devosia sediminis]MBJ3785305.1 hypothetical protein [Devosia sediminis]